MKSITFSDTLSLIGCVTGCLGFFISLFSLWKERYCLKIEYLPEESFFFDAVTVKKYLSKKQAIIHLTFRNKSVSPITIHDAYAMVDNHYTRFEVYSDSPSIDLPAPNHPDKGPYLINKSTFTSIPMDKQFELSMRLDARDSKEFIAFIPYFPCPEAETLEIIMVLKTAIRKKQSVKITLSAYKYQHCKSQNDHDGNYN